MKVIQMKKLMQLILVSLLTVGLSLNTLLAEEYDRVTVFSQISNVDFCASNTGTFGHSYGWYGLKWPRGTANYYLFGSGIWFGAQKWNQEDAELKKLVVISYNPINGKSLFVPGSVADADTVMEEDRLKYDVFQSTKYNILTGESIEDGSRWPVWTTSQKDVIGKYIFNEDDRNQVRHSNGPVVLSEEDLVCVFKETSKYSDNYKKLGYPLGLEIECRIYSWSNEEMKDQVISTYFIRNMSADTLWDCSIGHVSDFDIRSEKIGSRWNDLMSYYIADPSLNLTYAWTDDDGGEAGMGFGYMGVSFLETPMVNKNGFVLKTKNKSDIEKQLGLKTSLNWTLTQDFNYPEARYDIMTSNQIEGKEGPNDFKMLLATDGFHLRPGEEIRFSLLYTFAMPAKGGEADGTPEDLKGITGGSPIATTDPNSLIGKVVYARDFYYNNIFPTFVDEERISEEISINTIAPNPTSGQFDFSFEVVTTGNTEITLYDQFGRPILQLWSGVAKQGMNTLNLNIDSDEISSGMYFIKVKQGRDIRVGKIILK
jgi:type IX secretion system substrate protein